ncbi:VOC family protein [Ottowia thiooxydans]|uniref:VOC family protein n=1 Tax=Ottowia thiooxydans TaxID=219182 RepID=UPI0004913E66|nr:VOC family protein [Ottowia thiooxydans]
MFSHVFVGISDFDRSLNFYRQIFQVLGFKERFCDPEKPWAGWESTPGPRPLFVIAKPFNTEAPSPGNGTMVAFMASSRAKVERVYELALLLGAAPEGAPGLRPEYHEQYFGAYFRDLDGNKLCVACHVAA